MFLEKALQALGAAAQHPLALGMYVLVIVSWLVGALHTKRLRVLLINIIALPEKVQREIIKREMPKWSPENDLERWLELIKLARLGILCIAAIIILSLALFYFLQAAPKSIVVAGQATLDNRPLENATITGLALRASG
jgi:hypothetical protein